MVRLKVVQFDDDYAVGSEFQFQNGAIKRTMGGFSAIQVIEFQFQNGAIKSWTAMKTKRLSGRFNSKMVRLKVDRFRESELNLACFNSKMVRLKGRIGAKGESIIWKFQFQNGAIKSGF